MTWRCRVRRPFGFAKEQIRRTLRSSVNESRSAGLGTTAAFSKLRVSGGRHLSRPVAKLVGPVGRAKPMDDARRNRARSVRGMPMDFDVESGSAGGRASPGSFVRPGRDDSA